MLGSSEGSSTIQCGSIRSKKGIDELRRAIRTAQPETISGVHSFELPADHFTKERWLLLSQDELSAREKLETKSEENLVSNTHPGVDVRAPLKTGRDRILKGSGSADGSDTIEVETKSFTDSVEPSAWRRIVTNGVVSRWEVSKPEEVVFFPYERKNGEYHLLPEDELKTRYSKTYNCLKKFKQDLLDRRDSGQTYEEMGKNWYELGRVGKPADYEDEKIVVGSMINNREFALDPDKYVVATGTGNARAITLGNLDKYYVLGYLNATPVHKYVKPLCPPKQSGYYEISISVLEELPYVDIDLDDNISEMITEKLEKNSPQEMSNSITKHGIKEVTNEFNHDVVAKHGIREGSKKIETHYDSFTDEQITGLEAFIDACTAALFDLTETDTEAFARI